MPGFDKKFLNKIAKQVCLNLVKNKQCITNANKLVSKVKVALANAFAPSFAAVVA